MDIWFRYNSQNTAKSAWVMLRTGGTGGGIMRMYLNPGNFRIIDDGVQRAWVAVTTDQDQWYDVRVKLDGSNVSVWRGESGEELLQLIGMNNVTTLTSARLDFRVDSNAQFWFDNIRMKKNNNLGEFLHLQSTSPVIDAGDIAPFAATFRDFDDQFSPIDRPGGHDIGSVENPQDMGADEYPTDGGFSYWWRRF